jgi:glycerol-1-phosphatase
VSHPEVSRTGAGFECRGWTAAIAAGGGKWLEVSGSGDALDGLRALCAAAWSADGDQAFRAPEARQAADAAVRKIGLAG